MGTEVEYGISVQGVPTANPRMQAILEASFEPGRLLDDDDFSARNISDITQAAPRPSAPRPC